MRELMDRPDELRISLPVVLAISLGQNPIQQRVAGPPVLISGSHRRPLFFGSTRFSFYKAVDRVNVNQTPNRFISFVAKAKIFVEVNVF